MSNSPLQKHFAHLRDTKEKLQSNYKGNKNLLNQETKALAPLLGKEGKMTIRLESTKEDRKHEAREKDRNLRNVTFSPDSGVKRFRLTFL